MHVGQRLPVVTESMIRFVYDVAHAGVRATDQFHTDWNPLGGMVATRGLVATAR